MYVEHMDEETAQLRRGMEPMSTLLERYKVYLGAVAEKEKRTGRKEPNSEKAYWWNVICERFYYYEYNHKGPKERRKVWGRVMGQTRNFTAQEIINCYQAAINWPKNPGALFWKLVREKQAEIKKQLAGNNGK